MSTCRYRDKSHCLTVTKPTRRALGADKRFLSPWEIVATVILPKFPGKRRLLGGAQARIHHCKGGAESLGIRFIRIKISVPRIYSTGVSDKQLRDLFSAVKASPKPIFVSCSLGRDRTGMVVALYRMKRGEMSFDEAWQEAVYYGYRPRFRGL